MTWAVDMSPMGGGGTEGAPRRLGGLAAVSESDRRSGHRRIVGDRRRVDVTVAGGWLGGSNVASFGVNTLGGSRRADGDVERRVRRLLVEPDESMGP